MCFGLMKQKWGIFSSPLKCKLKNIQRIMLAVAHLHNYCINRRLLETGSTKAVIPVSSLHGFSVYEEGMRLEHAVMEGSLIRNNEFRELSGNWIAMVKRVKIRNLKRPPNFNNKSQKKNKVSNI